jgi:hypothetical protein
VLLLPVDERVSVALAVVVWLLVCVTLALSVDVGVSVSDGDCEGVCDTDAVDVPVVVDVNEGL